MTARDQHQPASSRAIVMFATTGGAVVTRNYIDALELSIGEYVRWRRGALLCGVGNGLRRADRVAVRPDTPLLANKQFHAGIFAMLGSR